MKVRGLTQQIQFFKFKNDNLKIMSYNANIRNLLNSSLHESSSCVLADTLTARFWRMKTDKMKR